jgi:hypothetical protein
MSPRYVTPLSVVRSSGRPLAEIMAYAEIVDGKPMIDGARAEMIISSALGALLEDLASPPSALAHAHGSKVICMVRREVVASIPEEEFS